VAKRAHSGYAVYASEHNRHSSTRLALTGELRRAIADDQLLVHYQPKVNFASRRVSSVEALVRWQHPGHGLLLPEQFMEFGDQTGAITPASLWVLDRALRQCRAWHQARLPIGVAVNLSTRALHNPGLPESLEELLQAHGVAAAWLKVEVTESALMADPARVLDIFTRLSRLDVRIAIDDFGTGYTPLAYLKRLPVDELKIDRSFVATMVASDTAAAIVRSAIDLGHTLRLKVVAEGVDSQEAWTRLAALGCDAAQGYYLSRPLPDADLERWLRESPWGLAAHE